MIVQPDFLTHWKTKRLINTLNQIHAPLYVLRLWSFCQTSRRDRVPNDPETIKAICDFDGDAKIFFKALIGSEFLEVENETQCIAHGWAELNKALIHNWEVGRTGGRPKGSKLNNPRETQGLASGNPRKTLGEPIRVDKIREDNTPPLTGDAETDAQIEICRLGYGWSDDGTHKHKLDRTRHRSYFKIAVSFMVRSSGKLILTPQDFAVYIRSYFASPDDPESFYDTSAEDGLTQYTITRINSADTAYLEKHGPRCFEFFVKDFNAKFGMQHNTEFVKARTEQLKLQNRRANR